MRFSLGVFFILTLLSFMAPAAELVRLYEWNPGTTLAPLILPVRSSETPEEAAQRYLKELSKNPELMELFEGRTPDVPIRGFKPLDENSREARALMIANLPKDYAQNSQRVSNFKKIFSQAKHSSYILPMNTNLGLSQGETRDLFKQISEKFPLLVAMGGEDVDPRFYKQENIHARNTIPARDQFEIELIKSYVSQEKGFLLGICRGSQISSVALGYRLIQDVPFHMGTEVSHGNDWHDIEIKNTRNNLLKSLIPSSQKMYVNSLHHQSVVFKEGGPLEIAARSHDGVTEATELKNGRGLLLQFHPEFMNNELGSKILWRTVQQKNQVMPARCSRIFSGK
ncbi:gamma-glutamyl-gamma-aminobutyrate hydrolase family protein [Bdellovibrio sp.]|uniref:gamma-glutamyl-gamma-aminobutyrate hydrolase family protein n=1 Tax=Bdellovibrio sp. TaxID=28201 RepID=UPI0039E2718B